MRYSVLSSFASAASVLAISMAGVAHAQDGSGGDAAETRDGDVIVVTGIRGRAEDVQKVPVSQTVFSAEEIEDAGIDTVDDLIGLTPGVTIANAQDAGTNFITIRGVSQVRNGEAPVAVIVDGVLQVNSRQFDQGLFNVESMEVVRGPQGARYGRNATGGAILINTKDPGDVVEGYVQASVAAGDEYGVEASISGPLVQDALFAGISARYTDRGGYFDNVVLGEKVDPYEEIALRGRLKWDGGSGLVANLTGKYVKTDGGSLNYSFQPLAIDPATGLGTGFTGVVDADRADRDFFATNLGTDERELWQISLNLEYETDFATFKSVTAYDRIKQATTGDQFPYTFAISSNAIFFDGTQTQSVDIEAFSQEFRISSPGEPQFRWEIGGYYVSTDRFISSTTGLDLGLGINQIRRNPFFGDTTNPTTSFIADDNDNEAYAGFFSLEYDITDTLEFSVAGRYDVDKRRQNVDPRQGAYDAAGNLVGAIGVAGAQNRATFKQFQPRVSLKWQASDNFNLYGSYGEGFRSGQFNQNGVGAVAAGAGVAGVGDLLDKEITKTYELGFKSRVADNRVTINGSLYDTSITNAPYFVFIGAVSAQVLVPIDRIKVRGGEIEVVADLSDMVTLYGSLGISDSEVKRYSVNPAAVGNKAPYVPNRTFNLGAQFTPELTDTIGLIARIDYENRGRQFWDPENTTDRSVLNLMNLRLGIEDLDGRWSLIGSYNNAFDEVYNSEWVLGGFAHAGTPDVWRVDLKYSF